MTGIQITPRVSQRARDFANSLLAQSQQVRPIEHMNQGIAQLAQALVGGRAARLNREQTEQNRADTQRALAQALGLPRAPSDGVGPTFEPDPAQQQQALAALLQADPQLASSALALQDRQRQQQMDTQSREAMARFLADPSDENRAALAAVNPQAGFDLFKTQEQERIGDERIQMQLDAQKNAAEAAAEAAQAESEAKRREALDKGTNELRKEFQALPAVKDATKVADGMRRFNAVIDQETGAGDLAAIFNFMKALDPGSVVRESEFQTAAQARAALDRFEEEGIALPTPVIQAVLRMETGQLLAPQQRQEFKVAANQLAGAAYQSWNEQASFYNQLAQRSGFDPTNVVNNPFEGLVTTSQGAPVVNGVSLDTATLQRALGAADGGGIIDVSGG